MTNPVALVERQVLEARQHARVPSGNVQRNEVRDFTHCPQCKVAKGFPCRGKRGQLRSANHQTRVDLWRFRLSNGSPPAQSAVLGFASLTAAGGPPVPASTGVV